MTILYRVALALHLVAGAVALATFWIPLVAKKGGTLHRRAGWVYVVAAGAIAATGVVVCGRLIADPRPFRHRAGIFLLYVGLLAATSALAGVRALRNRQRTKAPPSLADTVPSALLVAGGVALAVYGLRESMALYVAFAALGTLVGVTRLRYELTPPTHRHQWLLAHMGGMGTSCITTVTAFVVVNAHRLGLRTFNVALWLAPIVLGAIGLSFWTRYYRRRIAEGDVPFRADTAPSAPAGG